MLQVLDAKRLQDIAVAQRNFAQEDPPRASQISRRQ
jgi:hypothetical protein